MTLDLTNDANKIQININNDEQNINIMEKEVISNDIDNKDIDEFMRNIILNNQL